MKQLTRKELYVIGILVLFSMCLLVYPLLQAQHLYDIEKVNTVFQTVSKQRQMEKKDSAFIRRSYQLNEDAYRNAYIYGHKGAMEVEEIAVFEVDNQQREAVISACEKRIAMLKQSFDGYGLTQMEVLNQAKIKQYGNVIVCMITKDADSLLQESEAAL